MFKAVGGLLVPPLPHALGPSILRYLSLVPNLQVTSWPPLKVCGATISCLSRASDRPSFLHVIPLQSHLPHPLPPAAAQHLPTSYPLPPAPLSSCF